MKLIDLLVQELPKCGGWPEGYNVISTNGYGQVWCYSINASGKTSGKELYIRSSEEGHVTREQYEAALAAAQQPVWNGEGLPPVGCECEVSVCGGWEPGRIVFSDENIGVAYVCESTSSPTLDCVSGFSALKHFRPIRSEADKRRDEVIQSIINILNDYDFELVHINGGQKRIATDIVERIASGMIPHIRIE